MIANQKEALPFATFAIRPIFAMMRRERADGMMDGCYMNNGINHED
jgi:hypothetical protein